MKDFFKKMFDSKKCFIDNQLVGRIVDISFVSFFFSNLDKKLVLSLHNLTFITVELATILGLPYSLIPAP